ncbi:MAG: dTMP kinase [Gammaproteobacteria bacterium]|nr:dTMP kinase [Gammaproteobacteria bacterium]
MMSKARGKFITVEGGEGAGKSTNIDVIKTYLEEQGIDYVQTREPGGTLIAEKMRRLLLDKHDETMNPLAELLLVFAARAQHIASLIKPSLDSGDWVLCDRFTDATYAYQGCGRKLNSELVGQLETLVQRELRPDLTIILDMEPRVGLERASQRGDLDRFEIEKLEFFDRVRSCYLDIAQAEPERCVVINAEEDFPTVRRAVLAALHQRLGGAD